ncbi:two-component system sensor histidine kinase YesM [Mobilisporobacter senegalensis]|uniref:Two-component system sensor histidine kinase YesM n=1 Tax=Mobilisporobacter senegalensis TaxID=1329262 RepID=A0A3N1XLC1_9FIRM|nr:histidine kinase [Mobilisporobacter senegalensis]ROR27503.1 two-component system sensor histidine kinase YesM [Mobilisporobacter senegalensis]
MKRNANIFFRFKDKKDKPISLRRRLLFLIVIAWIVPVCIIFIFISMSYRNNIIDKTETLMEESLKNFTSFHAQKLDEAITISKKTSYELVIEKAWRKFHVGNMTKAEFYKEVISNLKSKYYNDNRFVMSAFYLSDEPERLYYTSRKPKSYIDTYYEKVHKVANEITEQETTDAHVKIVDGKIYIIRNLYTTTNYTKFGTLVVELNKSKLFDGLALNTDYELGFFIDDSESMIVYDSTLSEESRTSIVDKLRSQYSRTINREIMKVDGSIFTGLIYQQKFDDYHFGAILVADKSKIYNELTTLIYIIMIIILIVIPVFIYMLYFIAKHITAPMGRMMKASKEVEKGKIGMQIIGEEMPNAEFSYLMDSFNRMSAEVKYLFDYAYNEKLARKEAKIIALQSQINPHFLNNTLEMMNWQARMAGDVAVSKMIEALGTLLDYSMDRNNKKLINLSEELRCADAYFYIISMRFGQRLRVEKEVDPDLLQLQVPQLILQPILENAVVHGVEVVKTGTIRLKVYKEEDNVILQVTNTGKAMTSEDVTRVQRILNGEKDSIANGKGKHVSLGIRNVNERIKLIYGEDYGLTILPVDDEETASTITIPYEMVDDTEKRNLLKSLLDKSE